jgi:DNA-binding beta-propeller fold protein YncE
MSVYEFDRKSQKVSRIFQFKATPGKGWDYDNGKEINSFQEKPVEAFLSHHDSILWVSLHNAGGIVPIRLFESQNKPKGKTDKVIYIKNAEGKTQDTLYVPLIITGKTPKVIACTSDDQYLMVSNWHSYNVSILAINNRTYPFGTVIKNTAVSSIPRGIVIDETAKKSYVAIMGGSSLAVLDNKTWEKTSDIKVASNPRHILQDKQGRLLVSFNSLGQIGCVDPKNGSLLFKASTEAQPRTMTLSKSGEYLFVTCYSGNRLMVYKVLDDRFQLMHSLDCPGKPVGVDVYEDQESLEAWVCSYSSGTLSVFRFGKIRN